MTFSDNKASSPCVISSGGTGRYDGKDFGSIETLSREIYCYPALCTIEK
jgi:hypothetical protein